jgi:hypothetical protein
VLSAHIDTSFGQQRYDSGVDYSTGTGSNGLTLQPLSADARTTFLALQHAINRIRASLGLAPIAETGILDNDTYQAIYEIASSSQPITQALQPFLADLKQGTPFNSYDMLASMLGDMANRARMWTALFNGLADTIWYSTPMGQPPYAPTPTSKWPYVIGGVIGAALGVAGTLFALSRT